MKQRIKSLTKLKETVICSTQSEKDANIKVSLKQKQTSITKTILSPLHTEIYM